MVQIKVKGNNQMYTVVCSFDDLSSFLIVLEERLKLCAAKTDARFEAFFQFSHVVKATEMLAIMKVIERCNTTMLGICEPIEKQVIQVVEGNLHSGQTYHFDKPILLLGSIGCEAFVSSSESIYCIGQVSGNVDLKHEDCEIHASSFFQANIRICDSTYQNVTRFSLAKVYYYERNVEVKDFKEEKAWVVQSQ